MTGAYTFFMKSPRDSKAVLERTELVPGLVAHACPTSGGIWIDSISYWDWFRTQPGYPEPSASFESPKPFDIENDSDEQLISPRSGRLMRKCRVGSGLGFRIDYDASSGFWLDRDEYETLRSHNLHDELHLICSPSYQRSLMQMRTSSAEQDRFEKSLGVDACDRISTFAAWLSKQPRESVAMAYLQACMEQSRNSSDQG